METTTPTTDHLLEGTLEWLHKQTIEWISDVQFWREELKFFYHVLRKSELRMSYPMQQVAEMEKELVSISSKDLNELETSLQMHERKLKLILESVSSMNELQYRQDHKNILFTVQSFVEKVRMFKKSVFDLVKK